MSTPQRTFTMPVMIVEGADSNDNRHVSRGSVTWNAPPMPVLAILGRGNDPELVGRLDTIERISLAGQVDAKTGAPFLAGVTGLRGTGTFAHSEPAAFAIHLIGEKRLLRVGADLNNVTEEVDSDEVRTVFMRGQLMGVTLVEESAFGNARIELDPVGVVAG